MTAAILSPGIGVWSALKGIPGPLAVLIGMLAFVIALIGWRAVALMRERGPGWLRVYTAELAGSLFSILVEIGEKLETPIITSDRYGDALLEDHATDSRITTRASQRRIADRLKDAYSCARDICVLPGCVSWSTSIADVQDVRNRISDLRILSEKLMKRFPDLPVSPGHAD
jgi:hypothetical protein